MIFLRIRYGNFYITFSKLRFFFPNYLLFLKGNTEGFLYWSLVVKLTFEKPERICLWKNKIEDTKLVSMKFIPTAAFFLTKYLNQKVPTWA